MQATPRLFFRDLYPNDTSQLFDIYSDKEAMKYRGSKINNLADVERMIRNAITATPHNLAVRLAVIKKDSLEIIGTILTKYSKTNSECTIGYSIAKKHWNKGYGTEIVKAMVKNLLAENYPIIKAWTHPDNKGSIRILEKMGFLKVSQEEFPDALLFEFRNIRNFD